MGSTAQYVSNVIGLKIPYCGSPATSPRVQFRSVIHGQTPSRSWLPRCDIIGNSELSMSSTRKNPELRPATMA